MSTVIMAECPICSDSSQKAIDAMAEYEAIVPGAGVCGGCADRIANAYSMKHGGEWLTWPDSSKPEAKAKKAVIGNSLRTAVFERDEYRCLRCRSHTDLRADHVIPESKGGDTTIENLQTLCQPCNSWKGTKAIDFRKGER